MTLLDRFRLDGKVAVVTGASKNVGLEVSRGFAEAGATVVMVARTEDLLRERAATVASETGARVETFAADVGVKEQTDALVAFVHERFDQVDVLVNNAYASGDTFGMDPLDLPEGPWEATIAANLMG